MTFAQNKNIATIDFDSNEPIPSVVLSCEDKTLGESDVNGISIVDPAECENFQYRYIGFHTNIVSSEALKKIDTLYFFSDPLTLSLKNPKYKPNKRIKKNQIFFSKHGLNYSYLYNEKNRSLKLELK